ncbi:MAG: hypothetical protein JWM27_2675 [Gemmatimonadetes bacterium]|nr:hypothetical protein [Gemmatimonadota bacterium]
MSAAAPSAAAVRLAARRPPSALRDDAVDGALKLALRLAGAGDPYASPLDLGDLDLPPVTGGSAQEQARLRAVAPLYLAGELESTRLLPAVELLAGLFASGAIPGDVGAAGEMLLRFRHQAHERLSADERDALFGRIFGKPYGPAMAAHDGGSARNDEFEGLMLDVAEDLSALGAPPPHGPGVQGEMRLHTSAGALAANLLLRSGGMTELAARDVLEQVRDALDILKVRELQAAYGAASVWTTVQQVARRYLGQSTDIVSRVARGRSGTTILGWLADALPHVGDSSVRLLAPGSILPGAADAWIQGSLALHDAAAPARGVRA